MEALFVLLNAIAALSPELEVHLRKILKREEFKKDEVIAKEGRQFPYIYFIESGLVRIYHIEEVEITTWFLLENDIFISPKSFFRGRVSDNFITALEDCVCWGITRAQLLETCKLFPEFHDHRVWITEEYYLRDLDRRVEMQLKSALERYASLFEKRPDLLYRVSLHLLPSFLGVGLSTFHKARNEYLRKRKGQ